jgi:hypothetical protein
VTYRVILQPWAERDIQVAAHWIRLESKSSAIALRWVRGIRTKIPAKNVATRFGIIYYS